jgi:acyl dehydratase
VYSAAARGIRLTEVESTLEADLDVRGAMGLADQVRARRRRSLKGPGKGWRKAGGRPVVEGAGMTSTPVGATARRTHAVTRCDIELFIQITGDRNPIHYDDALAAASRFGGVVVQGGVTSGLLNALVAEQLPGPASVLLEVAWRFLASVRPGDVLTAEATVTATRG